MFLAGSHRLPTLRADMQPNLTELSSQYHTTRRECRISELVRERKTNREIAEPSFVSHQTVKIILAAFLLKAV